MTSRFSEMSFICSSVTGLMRKATLALPSATCCEGLVGLAEVADVAAGADRLLVQAEQFFEMTLWSCVTSSAAWRGERPASSGAMASGFGVRRKTPSAVAARKATPGAASRRRSREAASVLSAIFSTVK
jgi:hypothetical protein